MTMNSTFHRSTAALLTIAALASTSLAQEVLLSEVRADGERWIEVHNRTGAAIDMSWWSLHYATHTVGSSQSYWWPFPQGTLLAADGYLRVHWFQVMPTGAASPGNLWTGTSPFGFLFGLGGEPLHAAAGALALFRSQDAAAMNDPAALADWVSWGDNGFTREPLAVQAGLWTAGRHLPPVPANSSHARDLALVGTVAFPDLAWFVDSTPTPLQPNATGASVTSHGQACALPGNHLLGAPLLSTPSLPLVGNAAFGFTIENTTGVWSEFVLLGISAGPAPLGAPSILPSFAGVTCQEAIDLTQIVATWLVPAQILTTHAPLSLAGVPSSAMGAELHAQALVFDLVPYASPPFQGITNALRVIVGQ
jgi:hypothetical protein